MLFFSAATSMSDTLESIRLSNTTWAVEIVPQSLAVTAYPEDREINNTRLLRADETWFRDGSFSRRQRCQMEAARAFA